MIEFPGNFLWGSATSSYQVEGNNSNADWWEWEKRVGLAHTSGSACRHYELYPQDFDLLGQLGHNAHRLSIEWSRVEPKEGEFSAEETQHYVNVIGQLKSRGIEPLVTLNHFTIPLWLAHSGGWLRRDACESFLRYVKHIVQALSGQARYWITINEPMVYVYHGYILGDWPPQERSLCKAWKIGATFKNAHVKAYYAIKDIYRKSNLPAPYISFAKNMQAFVPCTDRLRDKFAVYLRDKLYNTLFLDEVYRHKAIDFIGINYYTRSLVEVQKPRFMNLLLDECQKNHHPLKKNSLNWDIYPEGLYDTLLKVKRYNLPVIITENGICTADDNLRWEFIRAHLFSLHRAMQAGVKVSGYIYWSLMDNFEWDKGFGPRFGLVDVDYNTYQRKIRESARRFALVCKNGTLE